MTDTRLLIKVRGDGRAFSAAARKAFGAAAVEIEPILTVPASAASSGAALGPSSGSTWLRVAGAVSEENPWNAAHRLVADDHGLAASHASSIEMIEPDIPQSW